jgi:colanic acid biosynthesis glycosyl transferase WcaI
MRIVLLNQCFHPDEAATALYLKDLAAELASRGHEVTVIASNRGYNQPELRFPSCERWQGVDILRIWTPGFGKRSILHRLVDAAVFWLNAARMLFLTHRPDVILSLTSPPLISVLGAVAAKWHSCFSMIWLMDMNPDQAVASGVLRRGSLVERGLTLLLNWSYQQAAGIFVLDRFMAHRLREKSVGEDVIQTIPPWSHEHDLQADLRGREEFRRKHGLNDKFVVMYSGNHSPCHPVDTVLEASLKLQRSGMFHFLFIGAGAEHDKAKAFAERHQLDNITCLPYQPLDQLSASLTSADLHLVIMGSAFVGIIHPCKIYNILSLGVPFLFIGPRPSHGSDIVDDLQLPDSARQANHGDVGGVVKQLQEACTTRLHQRSTAMRGYSRRFLFEQICPQLITGIEKLQTLG